MRTGKLLYGPWKKPRGKKVSIRDLDMQRKAIDIAYEKLQKEHLGSVQYDIAKSSYNAAVDVWKGMQQAYWRCEAF